MEHRRVADLHVPDVLRGRVLGQLVGGAVQRVLGLQHLERDVERLEVLDQPAGVLADVHAAAQLVRSCGRQLDALLLGQLEDRLEAHRAVEVDVEIGLGELLEER